MLSVERRVASVSRLRSATRLRAMRRCFLPSSNVMSRTCNTHAPAVTDVTPESGCLTWLRARWYTRSLSLIDLQFFIVKVPPKRECLRNTNKKTSTKQNKFQQKLINFEMWRERAVKPRSVFQHFGSLLRSLLLHVLRQFSETRKYMYSCLRFGTQRDQRKSLKNLTSHL